MRSLVVGALWLGFVASLPLPIPLLIFLGLLGVVALHPEATRALLSSRRRRNPRRTPAPRFPNARRVAIEPGCVLSVLDRSIHLAGYAPGFYDVLVWRGDGVVLGHRLWVDTDGFCSPPSPIQAHLTALVDDFGLAFEVRSSTYSGAPA